MQKDVGAVVVVGTGGTIAGTAASAARHTGYRSGVLDAAALVAAVPALRGLPLHAETLVRLDRCDMDHATWAALAECVAAHLSCPGVAGVVVTHGTDTLEETAYFLHRTVAADKPLVLTAAMRPATALSPDGPQNLFDAVTLARTAGVRGVLAVLGGVVHEAASLRKLHGYRVDAFGSGDAGPVALMEDGAIRFLRPWPASPLHAAAAFLPEPGRWPVVDIVTSHAGARAAVIDALVDAGAHGIVIAGTGNGSVHREIVNAARRAEAAGVRVWRASRCLLGGVVGIDEQALHSAGVLTPAQARIELMLDLMAAAPLAR